MADEVIPSFNAQLRALKIGDSLAKAERFRIADTGDINEALQRMRNTVNAAASRVRMKHGSNFRVESGALITSDNEAVIAVVTATRI